MRTHIRSYSAIIVLLLAAAMLISLFSVPARAAGPWYVASTGSDGNSCLSAGNPCATINGAIGKASSGDTVYVATVTYTSTSGNEVVLIDKDINLSGGWDQTFTAQTSTSTIDGGGARRGITVNSGITSIIEHFIIQNGLASDGGGIRNYGSLTLNSSNVSGNTASVYGSGIYNSDGAMTLNNSNVSGNTANYSGGGIYNSDVAMTLNNSTISSNTSVFGWGGGIYNSGSMTLNNSTVNGNTNSSGGGGIYNDTYSGTLAGIITLNNSIVSNNTTGAGGNGGGGIFNNAGTATLNNSTVSGNTTPSGANGGAGIHNNAGTMILNNSTVSGNINSYGGGGGIHNGGGTMTLNNSTISGNTGHGGAGISNNYSGTMTVINSTISGNTGFDGGGGISNYLSTLTLNNSTVSGNTNTYGGGGIHNFAGTITLNNSTVSGNIAHYSDGGGIYNLDTLYLQNSILAGNSSSGTGPDCFGPISSAGYNLIGNTAGCTITGNVIGNLTGKDPLLSPLQDNGGPTYTQALLQGSPAINAGNPAGCTDQLGNPLVTDQRGEPRVGRCDMGAYELQPLGFSTKLGDRQISHRGEAISYTITLDNPGTAEIPGVQLSDTLPAHLGFVNGSLSASKGQAAYQNGVISWSGTLAAQEPVQVAFAANVDGLAPLYQPITNTAEIQGGGEVFLRDAAVLVEPYQIFLPVILKPCLPLYFDDFSNPASGWLVADDGSNRYEYLNGEYRILVRPAPGLAGVDPGFRASDYSVSVDLRNPNGRDGSYGITFGIADDGSTLYSLEIFPDGGYVIYRWDPTDTVPLIEAFSTAIHPGTASNRIKVERIGSTINAYANGQLLASVTDGTYTGSRYIGLVVFSNQPNVDIRFDNFTVYSSSCPGPATALSVTNGASQLPIQRFLNIQRVEKSHSMLQR